MRSFASLTSGFLLDVANGNLRCVAPNRLDVTAASWEHQPKGLWKIILQDSPGWMRYMVYGFFGYVGVNFLFFMSKTPGGGSGANPPAAVWRGFSGDWMAFYSAALAILYSAARTVDSSPRCTNGHTASLNATYCPQCGQPVMRVR
jgi:hypothetical protein